MFILVYGEDVFRVRTKEQELRQAFEQKFDVHKCNTDTFEITKQDRSIDSISQALMAPPFLSEKRFVVLRGVFSALKKEEVDAWAHLCTRVADSTICVFVESTSCADVEKHPLFKKIQPLFTDRCYSFPILGGRQLVDWLSLWAKQRGVAVSEEVVRALIARIGADTWHLTEEIKKLHAFALDRTITKEDVIQLTVPSFEGALFACMDAISSKSPRAWQALLDEWSAGTDDGYVFSMIVRQVRLLSLTRLRLAEDASCSKTTLANELSLHPFVAGKLLVQAMKFTPQDLLTAQKQLSYLDEHVKTGKISMGVAVRVAVAALLQT